jgi:hypothetical protein
MILVYASEVVAAPIVVYSHFARLHPIEFALHLTIQRLAHVLAHLPDPARHRPGIGFVKVCKTRFIEIDTLVAAKNRDPREHSCQVTAAALLAWPGADVGGNGAKKE